MNTPNVAAEETGITATAVGPNVLRVGDSVICSGIEPMFIPSNGEAKHVRQVFIRLPVQFADRPAVIAVCDSRDAPASASVPYTIFSIGVVAPSGPGTIIKISALDPGNRQLDGLVECDYIVIGKAKT
jgi:hypothetical protein